MFRPATSLRTPSNSFFAELYLTPGPQEIGVTGDNSYGALYGSEWLFMIEHETRILRAYQRVGGTWLERTDDPRMPPIVGQTMPESVRRLSGTFDQSARAVIAYEDAEGIVRVTRWDPSENQYVQNVTFAGVDPCVVMDASWSLSVPGSDVLLFYLSPDRTRVLCRVQRDVYAIEHEIWDYGAPVILDRVIAAPIRYQLLVSDAAGVPLLEALVSDPYPYPGVDAVASSATLTGGGQLIQVVLTPALPTQRLGVTAAVTGAGALGDPILDVAWADALTTSAAVTGSGAYEPAIISAPHTDSLSPIVSVTGSGAMPVVVIEYFAPLEALDASVGVSGGGTYGPP